MNKKLVKIGVVSGVVLIILLAGVYLYRLAGRNAVEILAGEKQLINILVAGSNAYKNNRHRFYAVISINPETGRIGVTFLPPNMRISTDARKKSFTKLEEIDIDSFNKIRRSLSHDIKLNIPFYVELYAPDVGRVIDLVEGINIYLLDQKTEIEGTMPGLNYLDGQKIIEYINGVEGGAIYKKYDRVQDVLYTLFMERDRYKRFTGEYMLAEAAKKIRTNIVEQEIVSLVKYVYKSEQLFSILVPGRLDEKGYYFVDDVSLKIYEKEFLAPLVIKEQNESSIKIKILNGTNVPGMAKRMRNILMREGLNVVEFGTSPFSEMEQSVIINRGGDTGKVMRVSELTGITRIYNIIDSTVLYNALIIIGKDQVK